MVYERIVSCAENLKARLDFIPETAVILGSGMESFVDKINIISQIPFSEIEGFPVTTVAGHNGKFILGDIDGKKILVMQGRIHYYEGFDISEVVLPIRVMGVLKIKNLFITNAAGGMNKSFSKGDIMLVTDHISSFVPSPLRGKNYEEFGSRFTDMTNAYDLELRNASKDAAEKLGIDLKEGIYIQVSGPNYETPAEIRMLSSFGDAVGMSTVVETMVARHMGIRVCALSHITNMGAGIEKEMLNHDDVLNCDVDSLCKLLKEVITIAC